MMNSERALRWCSAANNWEEFSGRVVSAAEKVDLSFLSGCRLQDIDETALSSIGGMQHQQTNSQLFVLLILQAEAYSQE